jgi:hypothetical protein
MRRAYKKCERIAVLETGKATAMQFARYKTESGAAGYAAELSATFLKREFKPVPSNDFAWNVGVFCDGTLIALAGKKKPVRKVSASIASIERFAREAV